MLTALYKASTWGGEMKEPKRKVTSFMSEIREDMKLIWKILPSPTTGSDSPLRLTDLGREVSQELETTAWARRQAATLQEELSGKPDYEVHEFSFDYVRNYKAAPEMDIRIKASAYAHGIDRQSMLNVLAIELRDVLLAQTGPDRD